MRRITASGIYLLWGRLAIIQAVRLSGCTLFVSCLPHHILFLGVCCGSLTYVPSRMLNIRVWCVFAVVEPRGRHADGKVICVFPVSIT